MRQETPMYFYSPSRRAYLPNQGELTTNLSEAFVVELDRLGACTTVLGMIYADKESDLPRDFILVLATGEEMASAGALTLVAAESYRELFPNRLDDF